MSMLVCVYYAPMFMLMDMDVTIYIIFHLPSVSFIAKQCMIIIIPEQCKIEMSVFRLK